MYGTEYPYFLVLHRTHQLLLTAFVVDTRREHSLISAVLLRAFEDESKARLGVVECAKHELLQPFTVLHEKEGEIH